MEVVIKFKYGVQVCSLPENAGIGIGFMDDKSGESIDRSSLDYDTSGSPRIVFFDDAGNLCMARRFMRDRNMQPLGHERLMADPMVEKYGDPKEVVVIANSNEIPDIEFVEVHGVRVYESKAAEGSATGQVGPELQKRNLASKVSRNAQMSAARARSAKQYSL